MKKLALIIVLVLIMVPVSVFAKGPPVVVELPPIIFTEINPCTGSDHEVTLTSTLRVHAFENNDRYHENTQFFSEVTTSDGFSGDFVLGPDAINIGDKVETYTFISNVTLSNDDTGELLKVHINTNITVVDGETKAEVDNFRLWCAGNHN